MTARLLVTLAVLALCGCGKPESKPAAIPQSVDSLSAQDWVSSTPPPLGSGPFIRFRVVMAPPRTRDPWAVLATTDPRVFEKCPQSIYKDERHSWLDLVGFSDYQAFRCQSCGLWQLRVPGCSTVYLRLPKVVTEPKRVWYQTKWTKP